MLGQTNLADPKSSRQQQQKGLIYSLKLVVYLLGKSHNSQPACESINEYHNESWNWAKHFMDIITSLEL